MRKPCEWPMLSFAVNVDFEVRPRPPTETTGPHSASSVHQVPGQVRFADSPAGRNPPRSQVRPLVEASGVTQVHAAIGHCHPYGGKMKCSVDEKPSKHVNVGCKQGTTCPLASWPRSVLSLQRYGITGCVAAGQCFSPIRPGYQSCDTTRELHQSSSSLSFFQSCQSGPASETACTQACGKGVEIA